MLVIDIVVLFIISWQVRLMCRWFMNWFRFMLVWCLKLCEKLLGFSCVMFVRLFLLNFFVRCVLMQVMVLLMLVVMKLEGLGWQVLLVRVCMLFVWFSVLRIDMNSLMWCILLVCMIFFSIGLILVVVLFVKSVLCWFIWSSGLKYVSLGSRVVVLQMNFLVNCSMCLCSGMCVLGGSLFIQLCGRLGLVSMRLFGLKLLMQLLMKQWFCVCMIWCSLYFG